jgi:hypothetical protein
LRSWIGEKPLTVNGKNKTGKKDNNGDLFQVHHTPRYFQEMDGKIKKLVNDSIKLVQFSF